MKCIIAGGRDFTDYDLAKEKCDYYFRSGFPEEIVSGKCDVGTCTFVDDNGKTICGADGLGERYAKEKGIPVAPFPADWSKGKKAGYFRNKKMAEYATSAIIFFDGISKGSAMMIKLAKENKLNIRIVNYLK